jgi:hypothetical protein
MESDIKLVDLRAQSLRVVKECIKIAESLGATSFRFYVNPTYIRNGLIVTSIVKLIGEAPPDTQYLIDLAGLKNLKATVDFAKKVLIDDGEANVEEREELFVPVVPRATEESEKEQDSTPMPTQTPAPKKRGRKKVAVESDESSEADDLETEESE